MKQILSIFLFLVGYFSLSRGWSFSPTTKNNPVTPKTSLDHPFKTQQRQPTTTQLYSSIDDFADLNDDNDSENNNDNDDDPFMASLRTRLTQSTKRSHILPLLVLDTMLPRQTLQLQVYNPTFLDLIRLRVADETPTFGMIGIAKLSDGKTVHLKYGVEVQLEDKPIVVKNEKDGREGLQITLVGKRRFCIEDGSVENDQVGGGWTEATVEFLESEEQEMEEENANIAASSSSTASLTSSSSTESLGGDTATTIPTNTDRLSLARAISKCRQFTTPNVALPNHDTLINTWISLARQHERRENQIDTLLHQLGEIPSVDCPSERALWVGALINPIPALGVALEIRPALLTAKTAEDRVNIALDGIWKSIKHMDGTDRLW